MKILLVLIMCLSANAQVQFPKDFFFGIANAPAHVEDKLDDIWIDHANNGGVYAFYNHFMPERRLDFWSHPEVELDLAKELGVKVFRLGVDWERIFPEKDVVDYTALDRYEEIFDMVRERNMKIMLTLFHHTEPRWTLNDGSWRNKGMINDFVKFSKVVLDRFHTKIDYVVTFNEANVYLMLGQIAGLWPSPLKKPRNFGILDLGPIKGTYTRSLKNIAKAHIEVYDYMKKKDYKPLLGVAHNIADYKGVNAISKVFAGISHRKLNLKFADYIIDHVDFLGLNYYGVERVNGLGVELSEEVTYSDSGRGISPFGFYDLLSQLHKRYNVNFRKRKNKNKVPFIITENGVADELDVFRHSYLIEHLHALKKAMNEGVNVLGYIHWTLSDNWEWADGYCPKFGLVSVDRKNGLKRTKRDSFYLYQKIASSKRISKETRDTAWKRVRSSFGKYRPFCRADDAQTPLDWPVYFPLKSFDWRFK